MATPPQPELSIIIATCNSEAFVGSCLASLTADDGVASEIIVVDNGSNDDTVPLIRTRHPGVHVIENGSNRGHCRAINQGLSRARGRYLLVLDVDTILLPGTVRELTAFLRDRTDAAVVAPRMLNPDGSLQETARRFPTVLNGVFGRQTLLTRLFPGNRFSAAYLQRNRHDDARPFEVDWVSAACMAFPRTLVQRIGLWDEGYGGYWVDADWCARAKRAGRVYCVPAGRVVHLEQNRRGRRKGGRRIAQFHAGVYRFYRKHYTRGPADPRALAAAALLAARAAVLIVADLALSGHETGAATVLTAQPPLAALKAGKDDQ